MTNKNKMLCVIGGATLATALVNHCIFRRCRNRKTHTPESNYYSSKYGKIHYITAGSGEPLLLVHGIGIGESYEEWRKSISYLSGKYTVYAIDLLGFGGSEKPKITYTSYLYVQLIRDFVKNVINEKTYVIASGASSAFVVLAHTFDRNLFKRLVLISPSGTGSYKNIPTNKHHWLRVLLDAPLVGTSIYNYLARKRNIRAMLKDSIYTEYSPDREVVKKHYNNAHADGVGCKYPISSFLSSYLNIDIERPLSEINVPIHVIWGEKNEVNPISNLRLVQRLNDNITATVFENTKILPHVENPAAFHKVIRRFLV